MRGENDTDCPVTGRQDVVGTLNEEHPESHAHAKAALALAGTRRVLLQLFRRGEASAREKGAHGSHFQALC